MAKKMLIDATHAEETRVVVVEGNKVEEFDFESLNKRQLAGNIYLAKVTRVEPSLQAAFVDYGGNRHGFLAFSEIHPDYYQIPVADREALLAEEAALDRAEDEEEAAEKLRSRSRSRRRPRSQPARDGAATTADAVVVADPADAAEGEEPESTLVEDLPESREHAHAAQAVDPAETPEDQAAAEPADRDAPEAEAEIDTLGAEEPREEMAPRRPRMRRYKIQEVIKVRQIMLVQVVKEERGNKGAALTTYLSLAGRYCVLMPNTARGGGISRKITNAADRKKLKEIASDIVVPKGAGLIIRTAGANRTKTEIKRDYEYLLRQWEQIRELTLKSIAPAHIYEEGSLIKRSIRDLYSRDIDEVLVEGEAGYREAKDYMKMLMPSHAKNVKLYNEMLPLFSRFQVESYLSAMFNPTVQLRSGGYIVIDVTEALVAVDVNSGRSTKEGSIEETALKTNLEAAEEVARQARLRDLAGLIVIDFIDMEDRRNNAAVEKRLKDKLKSDRARIQVGRISGFGLLEMSRQRLRPGMLEATTAPCPHCHGTGRVRSNDSMALAIMRELEEEGVRQRSKEVLVTAPVEIANYILNTKREHVAMIEGRFGLSVRIEGNAAMISPEYKIERFSTATRVVPQMLAAAPIRAEAFADLEEVEEPEDEIEAEAEVEAALAPRPEKSETGEQSGKKRRRRRRRKGGKREDGAEVEDGSEAASENGADEAVTAKDTPEGTETAAPAETEEKPKKSRSRTRSRKRKEPEAAEAAEPAAETAEPVTESAEPAAEVAEPVAEVASASDDAAPAREEAAAEPQTAPAEAAAETAAAPEPQAAELAKPAGPKPRKPRVRASAKATIEKVIGGTPEETAEEPAAEIEAAPEAAPAPQAEPEAGTAAGQHEAPKPDAPKRRGWWSRALSGS
ncbi:ribonuclease E/G [Halovulum dunhuangense]|uniref:Ribonuclease E n=1 Tax=Halovulum dunhuangense TaxID=1505036 RepID=A0A849L353_9RHOB|nr:ribonuclease E/G [Halovulum dunhuangense]NNU80660.1 ribonuclease E/G [Halovulum dunhuangense]